MPHTNPHATKGCDHDYGLVQIGIYVCNKCGHRVVDHESIEDIIFTLYLTFIT